MKHTLIAIMFFIVVAEAFGQKPVAKVEVVKNSVLISCGNDGVLKYKPVDGATVYER